MLKLRRSLYEKGPERGGRPTEMNPQTRQGEEALSRGVSWTGDHPGLSSDSSPSKSFKNLKRHAFFFLAREG